MSEFSQIDIQIGTEEQFETKKSTLSEGVIVGLTDPIHKNELDSDLQTKIDGIKKIYQHRIALSGDNSSRNAYILLINTDLTPFTFETFRALLGTSVSYSIYSRFNNLPVVDTQLGLGSPPVSYQLYDAIQRTISPSGTDVAVITAYYKSAYDTDALTLATIDYSESDGFTDNVVEI